MKYNINLLKKDNAFPERPTQLHQNKITTRSSI